MKHIGLFEGIGGFSLAARWMGWETVAWCEWNDFGQRVLRHHFPEAIGHGDITKTDFTPYANTIDILTGGFPCQPYSAAGKRRGKEDDRHLWPEMLRAIREIAPRYVVGENVLGLVNWNGGMVFDEVCADLESERYEVTPVVIPAAAVNAPHGRDRVWFVAHTASDNSRRKTRHMDGEEGKDGKKWENNTISKSSHQSIERPTPDTTSIGFQGREQQRKGWPMEKQSRRCDANYSRNSWQNFPTQPPVRSGDDGVSRKLAKFVVKELYHAISNTSEENRIKNLPEVWQRVQSQEIWEQIRRFYSLESKEVLFQVLQLYSETYQPQGNISPFCEDFSKPILQHLQKHKEFRRSPQGRELEKQRQEQFGNTLSFLPHEVALASKAFEKRSQSFYNWHCSESIKAYGNAIVPQVALELFKAIEQYENQNTWKTNH